MQKYAIFLHDVEIISFYVEAEIFAEDILATYNKADHFEVRYELEKIES